MLKHYDVGLTGLWTANDYGNALSYFALYKTLEEIGYSVLMLNARVKPALSLMDDFFQAAYGENRFSLADQAKDVNALCDRFLVGSGEVWNYGIAKGFQERFYLNFVHDERPKIAYAASFGHRSDFVPAERKETIRKLLQRFQAVSVREEVAQKGLAFSYDVEAQCQLPPVLLNPEAVFSWAQKSVLPAPKNAYVLFYHLDDNKELENQARQYAARHGYTLLDIRNISLSDQDTFQSLFGVSPDPKYVRVYDFLKILQMAESVVTDSFGASLLALAAQKTVWAYVNSWRGEARFSELFHKFNISRFLLRAPIRLDESADNERMNFQEIEAILSPLRQKSRDWLAKALSLPLGDAVPIRVRRVSERDSAARRQKELYERICGKSVVLMGSGKVAQDFCNLFGDKLHIRCLLTDRNDEKSVMLKNGTRIPAKKYEKSQIQPDDFIILCRREENESYYTNSQKCLLNDGFAYGRDFVNQALAGAVLNHKTLVSVVGYCQLLIVQNILKTIPAFTNLYFLSYYSMITDVWKNSFRYPESVEFTKLCDILIYVPLFAQPKAIDTRYDELAPPDTVKFRYPTTPFRGLHPYKHSDLREIGFLSAVSASHPPHPPRPFQYAEPYLDDLIAQGKSNAEICDLVLREDFIPEEEIQKNFRLGVRTLQISEAKSDLRISDYVAENCTKRLLYRDCLHYENSLYYEVVRRIAHTLGLCAKEDVDHAERQNQAQWMDITEVPILPCVAKALHIDFATDEYLYRLREGSDKTVILVTRRQWIENYCDLARAIKILKDNQII